MTLYDRVRQATHGADARVFVRDAALSVPYAIGWLLGKAGHLVWLAGLWLWHCVRLGALDGWGGSST